MTAIIDQAMTDSYAIYHGDSCQVIRDLPDNSIDFGVHSPPFANLYIYSDSEADMGNCVDDAEFIRHYEFLIREMHRITVPGRVCAVHCKDLPKYANRDDTAGLKDFPGQIIAAYERNGWSYHSRVTVWKCPVVERERTNNNGLLHKTVLRDRSQLRQGMADYLIVFRKPPIGTLMSDKPVCKFRDVTHTLDDGSTYTESEAIGFEHYVGESEYDPRVNESHPSPFARGMNRDRGTQANSIDIWRRYAEPVWWDICQTDVLNKKLARGESDERHICPLQLGLIERAVSIWSMPGDVVFSPFAGIGSEGVGAIRHDRKFVGIELKREYWETAIVNLDYAVNRRAESETSRMLPGFADNPTPRRRDMKRRGGEDERSDCERRTIFDRNVGEREAMILRDYQISAVLATWNYLCDQPGNPVIVLPTGAGKTVVISQLAKDAIGWGSRVLVLAHRQELLQQNADKLRRLLPGVSVGLFSSGLRRWDAESPVVCAGIQSCWKKAEAFGSRQLILIDEVHLVSMNGEGMYRKFLADIQAINTKARLVGLTATPYRTGEGSLCGPDKLFQGVAYEAEIPGLIEAGYLSPITSQATTTAVDTSGLHVRGGEFIAQEVERLFDSEDVVGPAVAEIVAKTGGRRSILVFCAGVAHAEHVARLLSAATGERVGIVTGDTLPMIRSSTLSDFVSGSLRWLVNVDVLTTGFDAPNIDALAVLRATCSPGLFAQMCGRGFRLSPGKENCVILDFGPNIERHGPLDSKEYGRPKPSTGRGGGDAPEKTCPNCEAACPLNAFQCECGFIFPKENQGPRHGDKAAEAALLEAMQPPQKWLVEAVGCQLWTNKKTGSRTLRVDYECQREGAEGNLSQEKISEWVCLEHDGFAGRKAAEWWRKRCRTPAVSIEDAVELWDRGAVATPTSITTKREGRFWRVLDYVLDPIPTLDEYREIATSDTADVFDDLAEFDDVPF